MAQQTQRQFQEERAGRNTGWNQAINRNFDSFVDDNTEAMPSLNEQRPRVLRPSERQATGTVRTTGSVRTTSSQPRATMSVPTPSFDLGDKLSGAGDRMSQAKPVLLFGGLSVALIVAYIVVSSIAAFLGSRIDNVAYLCDQTCTTHAEAFVGHPGEEAGLPSHFIGLNLRGQITVIEFPGSNASKAMTISGPFLFGKGEEKVPVQLSLQDLNGDSKADLIVSAKGAQTAYLNDGAAFRVMTPEERASVERALNGAATQTALQQPKLLSAPAPPHFGRGELSPFLPQEEGACRERGDQVRAVV